jgi:hypothetical protein
MRQHITNTATALAFVAVMFLGVRCPAATNPVVFNGVGASVLFNTFALAADSATGCGTNIWTYKKGASGIDSRSAQIPAEVGNVWIVWNNAETTICAFLAIDATVGAQLFFAVPKATLSIPSSEVGAAGQNLVPTLTDTTLPQAVYTALNAQAFNAAVLDSRPEDALFHENRVLGAYDPVHYNGLGYGPGPVGVPIQSTFSTTEAVPVAFAISGDDPISGAPVPAWTTTNVGASPEILFVNTSNTGPGDFGTSAFQNVDRFDLTLALNGTFGLTRDLTNQAGLPAVPLNVILREPLAGAYNVLEYSVPRSVEIASTQELGVNPTATGGNPLDLPNGGTAGSGWRKRALSSSEEVSEVGNDSNGNVLGYTLWSTGNFASVVGNTKYLTVDGVDPLYASYAGGFFPTCVAPCPGIVSFTNIINGSYPIWTVYRVASAKAVPPGVSKLVAAAQTQAANTIPDFVPFSALQVFRSHYTQSGKAPSNGFITGHPESGGDLGGAVLNVQADLDFYTNSGKELLNLKQ